MIVLNNNLEKFRLNFQGYVIRSLQEEKTATIHLSWFSKRWPGKAKILSLPALPLLGLEAPPPNPS